MAKWTNQNRAFCPYFIVIIFLSSRERNFPIPIRQWCRNRIGAFPLGLYLDGFPCFRFDSFGLHHHRDHDHNSPFPKLRKCSQIRIWDPGDSNYISEIGGLRLLIRHTYGNLCEFVLEIGALIPPRSQTSILLCIDAGTLFHLMVPSFGIRVLLLNQKSKYCLALMEFTQFCLVGLVICCTTIQLPRSRFAVFVIDVTSTLVMISSTVFGYIDRDHIDCMMDSWFSQFGFYWFALSTLHVGSAIYWRQGFVDFDHFGRSKNVVATLRWVLLDMRGLGIWDAMVNFFVVMLKRITQAQYFKETLVRKCWCLYVYIPELALDTSALMLRFVKRSHSQKLLYTIRNKEKSNMKLDNNRFFDRLASKATLRKASSNSFLLYFLLVYDTYICVCNNCISLILYAFVITLLV